MGRDLTPSEITSLKADAQRGHAEIKRLMVAPISKGASRRRRDNPQEACTIVKSGASPDSIRDRITPIRKQAGSREVVRLLAIDLKKRIPQAA